MSRRRGEIYKCEQCGKWWVRREEEVDYGCPSPSHCHHVDNPVTLKLDKRQELETYLL